MENATSSTNQAFNKTADKARCWLRKTLASYSVGLLLALQLLGGFLPIFTVVMIISYGILLYVVPYRFRQQLTLQSLERLEHCAIEKQSLQYCLIADYISSQLLFKPLQLKNGYEVTKLLCEQPDVAMNVQKEGTHNGHILLSVDHAKEELVSGPSCKNFSGQEALAVRKAQILPNIIAKHSKVQKSRYEPLAPKATKLSPAVRRMIAEVDTMMAEVQNLLTAVQKLDHTDVNVAPPIRQKSKAKSRTLELDAVYDGDDEKTERCIIKQIRNARAKMVRFDENVVIHEPPDYVHHLDEQQRRNLYYDAEEVSKMTHEYFHNA